MRSRTGGTAKTRAMLGVVAWSGAVYSLGAHKEWRFLHPLLPLLHVCAAKSLVDLNDDRIKSSSSSAPPSSAQADPSAKGHRRNNLLPPIRPVHLALLLLNVPAAYYVLRWHGAAQISVMHYLRGVPPRQLDSLGFLMPCHSTPWQAHLHRPELAESGRVWALGCEPPVLGSVLLPLLALWDCADEGSYTAKICKGTKTRRTCSMQTLPHTSRSDFPQSSTLRSRLLHTPPRSRALSSSRTRTEGQHGHISGHAFW